MRRFFLTVGVVAMGAACARTEVPRPTKDASRTDFITRGKYVFASDTLVGEGGKSCAGCHENHVPFEDYSLARKYYELPKLVDNCLTHEGRTRHKTGPGTTLEQRALREYVVFNYILKGVIEDEEPEGIRLLGESMELFLQGGYEDALGTVREARKLVKTEQNNVQSYALEGCMQLFQLNEKAAKDAFAEALRLDPKVRIDGYVFSPKVLGVLESVRVALAPVRASAGKKK